MTQALTLDEICEFLVLLGDRKLDEIQKKLEEDSNRGGVVLTGSTITGNSVSFTITESKNRVFLNNIFKRFSKNNRKCYRKFNPRKH